MTDVAFVAGAVAGVFECLVVQPLDMVKTRFQLHAGNSRPAVSEALMALLREGGVPRLYRGVLPELAAMTPKSSAMYSAYEASLRALEERGVRPMAAHLAAGITAGVPEAAVVTPFQVVKVRLQAKEHLGRYHGTLHCLRTVLAEEGPRALASGFFATCWRNCVWNGVFFATLHGMRTSPVLGGGDLQHGDGALMQSLRTGASGFLAGVFATCFNAPFDVVKSRIQAERRHAGDPARPPPSVLGRLVAIMRTEGLQGVYAGLTPKAMRMGLGGAVGILAFEVTKKVLT